MKSIQSTVTEMLQNEAKILDDFLKEQLKVFYPDADFSELNSLKERLKQDGFYLCITNRRDINAVEYSIFHNSTEINRITIKREITLLDERNVNQGNYTDEPCRRIRHT